MDRERLVRIELKQYENMDKAERQLIKSVERKEGDKTESRDRIEIESKTGESVPPYIQL